MTKSISLLYFLLFLTLTGTTCTPPTEPGKETGPDTTSQNFTFETFEFGDGLSSSYLNDVWIFDENNIWAVGYISKTETNPAGNIIQWNGKEWKIKTSLSVSNGMTGIWAVDSNNVYLTTGLLRKYQNGQIIQIPFPFSLSIGQAVTKLWGSSATNIWGVGPNGTVVHYDGVGWKKIELSNHDINPQNLTIKSIKGNSNKIWFVGFDDTNFNESIFAEISNNDLNILWNHSKSFNFHFEDAIYNEKEVVYWVTAPSIARMKPKLNEVTCMEKFCDKFIPMTKIWRNSDSDIFIISENGMLFHYNGSSWKSIEFGNQFLLKGIKSIGNELVIVGHDIDTDRAIIIRGHRK